MHGKWPIFLLTYMVAVAILDSLAFNIDTLNASVHEGNQSDFYGYKVHQFKSGNDKGIIVTAPLQLNGTGGICNTQTQRCYNPTDISIDDTTIPVKHFGLSIAEDSTRSRITICSPNVAHGCDENSYLNSVCYNMRYDLGPISSFKPAFQECTKKKVDLVFLFDGSESMTAAEFHKNKEFIVDIMNDLQNTSFKFAAAQFSTNPIKVFDFNDYEAGRALEKLMREPHMRGLTNTHRALTFVLKAILENPDAGASPDSIKVVVVITDGDPSDTNKKKIIETYDNKAIIRFVIGVKDVKLDKFRAIASEPKDKNAFKIENYDGLTGVLGNFQNRIFNMEGSTVARAGDLTDEMAQSGFSAVFYKDTLILGSVGSNTWRGSLNEYHGQKEKQIKDPQTEEDSYLGYSVSVGEKNNVPLYFTGAPRFEHTGQVVLFKHDGKHWTMGQRITGDQIGAYFGAELCSVDVNSDSNTDFLLVGAPLFYQPQVEREGQIYVYKLTDEMKLKIVLNVTAPSMGRFGTTISALADLNGDGLRDVAIGAPLEDDNKGVVYIYLGDRHTGIRSTFSQRIQMAGVRFFGQAIDGNIDLGGDGLPDIVIGSQGKAIVLRSRPVFNVTAHLYFQPKEISIEKIDCTSNTDNKFPMITLTACFEMIETTESNRKAMSSGLAIKSILDVDPMRERYRGFFSPTDKKARNVTNTYNLTDKKTCFNYTIYMLECVKDTLSPLSIKLSFSQPDSDTAAVALNVDSKAQANVEVPFEKHCRKNDTCIAELKVDFDFMTETLLVSEDNYFNLSVTLTNQGDDSYNTTLSMHYPEGLSFSMMTLTERQKTVLHNCNGEGAADKTTCAISPPVYRSGSTATFKSSFHVMKEYEWNETISMTITGESDNANSTENSQTRTIPVQFEIKMAAMVKDDTPTYLNFTPEANQTKKMVSAYRVDNPGWKSFPVNVSLVFPTNLEHNFEMSNYHVLVKPSITVCRLSNWTEPCLPQRNCKVIWCDTFILDKESTIEFELSGDVEFKDLREHATNMAFVKRFTGDRAEVKFQSSIQISYDRKRYVLDYHKQEGKGEEEKRKDNSLIIRRSEVRVEFIIPANRLLIIITGCVLGFLLLMIIIVIMFKLGCFKLNKVNQLKSVMEEIAAHQDAAPPAAASTPTNGVTNHSETDTKSDQPLEEKKLLNEADSGEMEQC